MKKLHFLFFLAVAAGTMLLSSCASLTGFQDGRTVGANAFELGTSLNLSSSPDYNKWADRNSNDTIKVPKLFFPSIELGGHYGVTDNFDVTLRFNTNLNIGLGGKYQFLGDKESPFAMAVGAELGTFGFITNLWNVQVPLYMSVHPTQKFAWYLNPRYIRQFAAIGNASGGLNYVGGNTGLLFGDRNKFGIDLGVYSLGYKESGTGNRSSVGMIQIGIGGRFRFGGGK